MHSAKSDQESQVMTKNLLQHEFFALKREAIFMFQNIILLVLKTVISMFHLYNSRHGSVMGSSFYGHG